MKRPPRVPFGGSSVTLFAVPGAGRRLDAVFDSISSPDDNTLELTARPAQIGPWPPKPLLSLVRAQHCVVFITLPDGERFVFPKLVCSQETVDFGADGARYRYRFAVVERPLYDPKPSEIDA